LHKFLLSHPFEIPWPFQLGILLHLNSKYYLHLYYNKDTNKTIYMDVFLHSLAVNGFLQACTNSKSLENFNDHIFGPELLLLLEFARLLILCLPYYVLREICRSLFRLSVSVSVSVSVCSAAVVSS
jgi:hypothetical protein